MRGANAPTGAVAFIHRFGSSLNQHVYFHVVVIDGVFEPEPVGGVRFIETQALDADNAESVQTQVPRRILRAFVRRGLLEKAYLSSHKARTGRSNSGHPLAAGVAEPVDGQRPARTLGPSRHRLP